MATGFLAVYGAALSTILALAKIIPEWPHITFARHEPEAEGVLLLRVTNPAKRALFIEGNTQFPQSAPPFGLADHQPLNRRADIVAAFEHHMDYPRVTPRLCVPAGGEGFIRVSKIEGDDERLIVFWWHRSWLLKLKLPMWVRVSERLVSLVNRAG